MILYPLCLLERSVIKSFIALSYPHLTHSSALPGKQTSTKNRMPVVITYVVALHGVVSVSVAGGWNQT